MPPGPAFFILLCFFHSPSLLGLSKPGAAAHRGLQTGESHWSIADCHSWLAKPQGAVRRKGRICKEQGKKKQRKSAAGDVEWWNTQPFFFFFLNVGIFCHIMRQYLVSSRAGAPCCDTHGGFFSHSYILEEKRWGKAARRGEPVGRGGWAHGAVTVWLSGHSVARGIGATCSRDVKELEVQKTTCPLGMAVSFQLLPPHGCAPDRFGVQVMRWGPAVGKYPPCVFLPGKYLPCVFLPVILWLEARAASLTDLGSLRLLGVVNTPRRGQHIWESLKRSSGCFWASWGLLAARKKHKQCSPLPLRALCWQHSCFSNNCNFFFFNPAFILPIFAHKNLLKTQAIFQVIPAAKGADAEWDHTCKEFVCPAFAVSSVLPLSLSILPVKDEESAITTACFSWISKEEFQSWLSTNNPILPGSCLLQNESADIYSITLRLFAESAVITLMKGAEIITLKHK